MGDSLGCGGSRTGEGQGTRRARGQAGRSPVCGRDLKAFPPASPSQVCLSAARDRLLGGFHPRRACHTVGQPSEQVSEPNPPCKQRRKYWFRWPRLESLALGVAADRGGRSGRAQGLALAALGGSRSELTAAQVQGRGRSTTVPCCSPRTDPRRVTGSIRSCACPWASRCCRGWQG